MNIVGRSVSYRDAAPDPAMHINAGPEPVPFILMRSRITNVPYLLSLNDGAHGQGRTLDFARGDAHFWLTYPLHPPGSGSGSASRF